MDVTRIERGQALQPGRLPLLPPGGQDGAPFATVLQQALDHVNGLQHDADAAAQAFALGQAPNVHDTVITMEKADLSLRLATRVRNKVVEAYQDIMRMQV